MVINEGVPVHHLSRAPAEQPAGPDPISLVLLACCIGQFMVVLDVSIVNVALPDIFRDLRMGGGSQQWVVNAYTITVAGCLLLGGRASDLLGRRRVFLAGLAVFTAASLLGGLAPNGELLIAARALQGLGGAVVAPASLSVLIATVRDPEQRRRAVGIWATVAAGGSAVGVLAGGVLTQLLGWRWVLLVNVPIGGATLVLGARALVPDEPGPGTRGLDLLGAATITAATASLTYAIVSGSEHTWTAGLTIGAFAAAAALLAAFLWTESVLASRPLVPLTIFRHRHLVLANVIALLIGATMFGLYYYLSLDRQDVAHDSPLVAGLSFLPAALATFIGAYLARRTVMRLGVRAQLALGAGLLAAGLFWLGDLHAAAAYPTHVLGPLVLCGAGFGLSFLPMTLAATDGVAAEQAGLAAGLVNTSRQLGGALGLAAAGAVVAAHTAPPPADPTPGYTAAWTSLAIAAVVVIVLCRWLPGRTLSRRAAPTARSR